MAKFTVGDRVKSDGEPDKIKVTLLSYYAGLAMKALLERPDREGRSADDIASQAFAVARAMVRENAKYQ